MRFSVGFYQAGPVSEAIRRAQLVESLGFHGMWLNDAQCRWRDVYVTLAAVGAGTSRIVLGVSVTNPITRHLTVTASAMYTLDELTAGRARMGISTGHASVRDIGKKPARMADLTEAVQTLRELWSGREVLMNGVSSRLSYAEANPRSIPVYLAGSGPRSAKTAGEIADGILLNVGAEPDYIRSALSSVQEGARAASRSLKDVRVAARIPACISDDPNAKEYVRPQVGLVVLRKLPSDLDDNDLLAVEKIRQTYKPEEHLRPNAPYVGHVTDSLVEKFALAGRPEECLERLQGLAKTGIDEINLALIHPDADNMLRTFAARVLNRL
ncbi:MAG: LLM class flavin-dependent oxidoreductase [Deltaproteobacteria bacterium]|nr:LLM class flavin-dependent oxidoreductase [Deltaproteobacteria bacterium]